MVLFGALSALSVRHHLRIRRRTSPSPLRMKNPNRRLHHPGWIFLTHHLPTGSSDFRLRLLTLSRNPTPPEGAAIRGKSPMPPMHARRRRISSAIDAPIPQDRRRTMILLHVGELMQMLKSWAILTHVVRNLMILPHPLTRRKNLRLHRNPSG